MTEGSRKVPNLSSFPAGKIMHLGRIKGGWRLGRDERDLDVKPLSGICPKIRLLCIRAQGPMYDIQPCTPLNVAPPSATRNISLSTPFQDTRFSCHQIWLAPRLRGQAGGTRRLGRMLCGGGQPPTIGVRTGTPRSSLACFAWLLLAF